MHDKSFAPGKRVIAPITTEGFQHVMFGWHPYAVDPKVDYAKEERTLLTVVESGFDKVPPARRMEAFRADTGGWETQLRNIQRHAAAA